MKLASLFSGGKDSLYAIYLAQKQGHEIVCILSLFPKSDESHLLHNPNIVWTKLQSKSMNLPHHFTESDDNSTDNELELIHNLLKFAQEKYAIEGIVHGGIKSNFQKENFSKVSDRLGLAVFAPLWNLEPEKYMDDLLDSNFSFMITSVSSAGLDDRWLGKIISHTDLVILKELSKKFQFNLNFEGGEAETFVLNCPLFSNSLEVIKSKKIWDGYRGRFEIVDARLNNNA